MNPLFLVPQTAFLLLFLLNLRKLFMRPNDAISREYECGETNEFLLSEHAWVPEGAAVGFTTAGYARSLQAGDRFVGFCQDTADNTGGGNGASASSVTNSTAGSGCAVNCACTPD